MFLIGRSLNCEEGQKVKIPKISTIKPPLTEFFTTPETFSFLAKASSIFFHDLALLAFSTLKTISPTLFSTLSI